MMATGEGEGDAATVGDACGAAVDGELAAVGVVPAGLALVAGLGAADGGAEQPVATDARAASSQTYERNRRTGTNTILQRTSTAVL